MYTHTCPACGKTLRISKEHAGKSGTCHHCRSAIQIPAAQDLERALNRKHHIAMAAVTLAVLALFLYVINRPPAPTAQASAHRIPETVATPLPYRFTELHRRAILSIIHNAGLPEPRAVFCEDGYVVADIQIPDEFIRLADIPPRIITQAMLLEIRNRLYPMDDADPNWNYFVVLKGSDPGPGLEYVWGNCLLEGATGEITWEPNYKVRNRFSWTE